MDIKKYLKQMEVTQYKLASLLEISRPTLDTYIQQYEEYGSLEKEQYNNIFKKLFSNVAQDKNSFYERLDSIKYELNKDYKYNINSRNSVNTDIISKIHEAMIDDVGEESWDEKIYRYILLLIKNYKNDVRLREYARYVTDLNSGEVNDIDDLEKKYFGYFYKMMHQAENIDLVYKEEDYKSFVNRKEEIQKEKERRKEEIQKKAHEKLMKYVLDKQQEYEESGIQLTADEIVKEIIGD